jgi:hypothetical protein
VAAVGGLKKFKMAAVAMVTKVFYQHTPKASTHYGEYSYDVS